MSEEKTKTFEAATQAEANRPADDWLVKQKGVRQTYPRSQTRGGFSPGEMWIVTIRYVEE